MRSLGLVAALLFVTRTALACPQLTIEADDPSLATLVRDAYASRSDIDTCAHVTLATRGARIAIAVQLPDGRRATRTVGRGEVLAALEALLRLPADAVEPPEPEPVAAPSVATVPLEVPVPALVDEPRDEVRAPVAPKKSRFGAELAAGTGVRTGDRAGYGVGGTFLFSIDTLLVGAQVRYDAYRGPAVDHGTSIDLVAGKRLRFEPVTVDLLAGAGSRIDHVGDVPVPVFTRAMPALVDPAHDESSPEATVSVRVNLRATSIFRGFIAADGAIGTAWSAGLSLGAAVGT